MGGADTIFLPVPRQPSSRSLPGRLPVGISSWEAMRSPFTWKRMKLMAQDDHTLWGLSVGLRDHRTKPRELSCNSPRTLALSGPQCHLLRYPRVQDTWRGPQKAPASSARWSLCQRSTRPSVRGHPPGQPPAKPGEAEKQRGARGESRDVCCLTSDQRRLILPGRRQRSVPGKGPRPEQAGGGLRFRSEIRKRTDRQRDAASLHDEESKPQLRVLCGLKRSCG